MNIILIEGKYFPKPNDYDTEHDFYWYLQQDGSKKLPGIGGVFNAVNLDVYHYAGQNPVKLVDPDGEAIFVFEINSNKQYGSIILIWNGVIPDGIYKARTRADSGNPAVKTGIYTYKVSNHGPNYFAKHKALKLNNDLALPTQKPNPKQGGKSIATGIRVHVGNRMNNENEGRTGSAGCWVIPAVIGTQSDYDPKDSNTWNYYNKFISNFKEGDVSFAVIIRAEDIKKFINKILKKD